MRKLFLFLKKLAGKKQNQIFLVLFLAVGLFFLLPEPTHALTDEILRNINTGIRGLGDLILGTLFGLINGILAGIITILGWLISFAVGVLEIAASYKEFSTQREVSILWSLVRDVMNSFFIVVLIVIAFATIIRWQPWQFKATLPKFIIAAIIINFSKTICLLAINFSTAIMTTFVSAIGESWGAFVLALRAPATVSFSSDTVGGIFGAREIVQDGLAVSALTTFVTSLFSIAVLVISFFAIMVFVFILLWRIIMLWMLIILSPAAMFLWAVPGRGSGYFKQWLDEFIKEVLIGPVIALMLYLDITFFINNVRIVNDTVYGFDLTGLLSDIPPAILTLMGNPRILFGYIVGIAFIFVSVEIVLKIGAKSVGLGTRSAKAAGRAGLAVRDLARASALREGGLLNRVPGVGRIAPFIPWSPVDSTKGILQGLANKRTKWNDDARKAQLSYAARQLESDKPGRARAFLARLNAGDTELGENLVQEFAGAAGSAASVIPGVRNLAELQKYRDGTGVINSRLDTYDAYDRVRAGFDSNLQEKFGDYTRDDFHETFAALKAAKEIQGVRSERDDIARNLQNGAYQTAEEREKALDRQEELQTQINNYEGAYDDYERELIEEELPDFEAYEKVSEIFDDDKLFRGEFNGNQSFGEIAGRLNEESFKADEIKARTSDTTEFMRRKSAAADALSSVRSDYQKERLEYMKKEYPIEEEVDVSTIFNRVLSHQNSEDKVKLSGDLVQAARQGDAQEVLRNFGNSVGKDFSLNSQGMQNLVNHLSDPKGVGLTKDEALELVADIQKTNYEEGRLAQGDFVKRDRTGKRKIVSEEKRAKAIERNLTKKALIKTLREGKVDAFGAEDAKGKFNVHSGAVSAMKKQGRQLRTILGDDRLAVQIPDRMLGVLEENAAAFGIADQLGRIQQLRS